MIYDKRQNIEDARQGIGQIAKQNGGGQFDYD